MWRQQNKDTRESLFSLEMLVEFIQLEKNLEVSDGLAVGVRLLDFPTLLIYPPRTGRPQQDGTHAFNRGKCCFFKMNLNSLHIHLTNAPLYAMLLDVKENAPRLLGSCLIPVGKATDRITREVDQRGASCPSCHRDQELVALCSLTGKKIGSISLSYKMSYLGESLAPHISERRGLGHTCVSEGQEVQEQTKEDNKSTSLLPDDSGDTLGLNLNEQSIKISEDKQDEGAERVFDDDLAMFCPPQLFYSNTGEDKHRTNPKDFHLLNWEAYSDQEGNDNENESTSSPPRQQITRPVAEDKRVSLNVLGPSFQQLPVLRALLIELSQLIGQNIEQSPTSHPSPVLVNMPGSTKPSTEQTEKPRRDGHFPSPRSCSTPAVSSACMKTINKQEEVLIKGKASRQKLVYGTTKTFNLRMKQHFPIRAKPRACVDLVKKDSESSPAKRQTKSIHNTSKSSVRKASSNQSQKLNEEVETVVQTLTVGLAQQGTFTVEEASQHKMSDCKQGDGSEGITHKISPTERNLKSIQIPSMDCTNVPRSESKEQPHSSSDQSPSDFGREEIQSVGSSRQSSPKSIPSDSSRDGDAEEDYADDFNSLASSDAFSPDPVNSPEPYRAKTPASPLPSDLHNSDSESDGAQRRVTALPQPVKASKSPQRALRATYVIRPQTSVSSHGLPSGDGENDGTACFQTKLARNPLLACSTDTDIFPAHRGHGGVSTEGSDPVRRSSTQSISSIQPWEAEQSEDELGSLDFRNQYQHISQLVAAKLPGYTM